MYGYKHKLTMYSQPLATKSSEGEDKVGELRDSHCCAALQRPRLRAVDQNKKLSAVTAPCFKSRTTYSPAFTAAANNNCSFIHTLLLLTLVSKQWNEITICYVCSYLGLFCFVSLYFAYKVVFINSCS